MIAFRILMSFPCPSPSPSQNPLFFLPIPISSSQWWPVQTPCLVSPIKKPRYTFYVAPDWVFGADILYAIILAIRKAWLKYLVQNTLIPRQRQKFHLTQIDFPWWVSAALRVMAGGGRGFQLINQRGDGKGKGSLWRGKRNGWNLNLCEWCSHPFPQFLMISSGVWDQFPALFIYPLLHSLF